MKYESLKVYIEDSLSSLYIHLTSILSKPILTNEEEADIRVIRSNINQLERINEICKKRNRY